MLDGPVSSSLELRVMLIGPTPNPIEDSEIICCREDDDPT